MNPKVCGLDVSFSGTAIAIGFTVFGKPAQMGSKKAFVPKGWTRAVITDDNSEKRKQWAGAVADKAAEAMQNRDLITEPLKVVIRFYFMRPDSHFGTGKNAEKLKDSAPEKHGQSPDLDKLIRCALDAMTGVVYRDDKQVWSLASERHWTTKQERAEVEIYL